MRAIQCRAMGDPPDLALVELPAPAPGPGEVLVEMRAAAVNFPDLLTLEGRYQVRPPVPFIPGTEGAGIVRVLGEGVTGLAVGDRVMVSTRGLFAEEVATRAENCTRFPDALDFPQAASLGIAFLTAHLALFDRAGLASGETVLIAGATGSVGLAAMQLAKLRGARVLAGLTTPEKAPVARENGADEVVDLATGDLREAIRDRVYALTDGRGVDVALDMIGGQVFAGLIRSLAWRGRLVVVGFTSGTIPELAVNYLLLKNIAVTGVNLNGYSKGDPALLGRATSEILTLAAEGKLRMPVQEVLPLARYEEAFALIRDRKVRGKIVLEIG
jgi:NADPH2:quinone reductase